MVASQQAFVVVVVMGESNQKKRASKFHKLATSPDGTLQCYVSQTRMVFRDDKGRRLHYTGTPGQVTWARFHPHKFELLLQIESRMCLVFDLVTKQYRSIPSGFENTIEYAGLGELLFCS
jgi:hypothetical protein